MRRGSQRSKETPRRRWKRRRRSRWRSASRRSAPRPGTTASSAALTRPDQALSAVAPDRLDRQLAGDRRQVAVVPPDGRPEAGATVDAGAKARRAGAVEVAGPHVPPSPPERDRIAAA